MLKKLMKYADAKMNPDLIQRYINDPETQTKFFKRTLLIVVLSQLFGGAGLAAGITVGALLAQDMLGTDSFAGLPTALFTLGSAGAAMLIGRLSQRFGRRLGLSVGFLIGGVGAIGVILAAVTNQVVLLFASLFIYGAGTASNLQTRYAGTDLAKSTQRATAVSVAMVSTTFGAVAGPNLVEIMGNFARSIGVPVLAGPFILSAAAFLIAGFILFILMRPDPLIVAKILEENNEASTNIPSDIQPEIQDINKKGIIAGATVMILSQIIMVAIMTMTPIHMGHHGHGLGEVGFVIGIHVAAMYLPSLVTGVLVDKIGRNFMAAASGVTLLAAGVLAAFAPVDSMVLLTTALALLGLGWNFGFISGTALLVDATNVSNRAKIQGTVDVLIALSGAAGGVLSGVIVAGSSYAILSLTGGILSLVLIPFVIWSLKSPRNKVELPS